MASDAADRCLLLLTQVVPLKDLAEPNSKEYVRWQNIKRGKVRVGIAEAELLAKKFPQYSLWIISGQVAPDIGQISPDLEQVKRSDSGAVNAG